MQTLWHPVLLAIVLFVGIAPIWTASAAEIRGGDQVTVKADETIADDLYAFGRYITIDGTVEGDLIAFGEQITINGTVKGDVMAAGQTVVLSGAADDARIAGQVLKLGPQAKLGGDILAAGFSLECQKESAVAGDALYAGYQALFAGQIDKDVKGGMANCRLEGKIGGDVDVEAGGDDHAPPPNMFGPTPVAMPHVPGGLTISETAVIDGDLHYLALREAKIDPQAKIGGKVEYSQPAKEQDAAAPAKQNPVLAQTFTRLRHGVCVALIGLAVLLLFPRWSGAWADTIRTRPAASLLSGLVGFVVFIALLLIAAIVLVLAAIVAGVATLHELLAMVIVGGIVGYAALIVGFWLIAWFLAEALAGLALGRLALPKDALSTRIVALLLGLVVIGLVLSIPYVGFWLGWVVLFFGLGGFCLWLIAPSPPERLLPPAKPLPAKA